MTPRVHLFHPDQEGFEFIIVSLDNKQWHFEAASNEEREEWVQAIEQQILSSLQLNEPNKLKTKSGGSAADNGAVLAMKSVPGNMACCDCDAPSKKGHLCPILPFETTD